MPIKAPVKGGADFEPIPAGSHHAICYGVVDLGTQDGGQYGPRRKILVLWELPEERIDLEREGKTVNLPRATSQQYTLSMHKKANLRVVLESWRARPFTDEEAEDFDITSIIGANCMVTIIHAMGSGKNAGRVFANVKGVNPLPKGMARRKLENPPLSFSLDDFEGRTIAFPENMSEWIQDTIIKSEEYRARCRESGHHTSTSDGDDIRMDYSDPDQNAGAGESFENARPVDKRKPAPGPEGSVAHDPNEGQVPF